MESSDEPKNCADFLDSIVANYYERNQNDYMVVYGWLAVVRKNFAGLLEYNFCQCCDEECEFWQKHGWAWSGTPDELYSIADAAPILGKKSILGRCLEQIAESRQ